MAEFDRRLTGVESYIAESRDDNDKIRLSEITEQIQQVTHTLEIMDIKQQGLENQIRATRRLVIAIGAAVAVILARILYVN